MPLTIKSKHLSQEITCGNFYLIKKMIARLSKEDIYKHYIGLDQGVYLYDEDKGQFYEQYKNTIKILSQKYNGTMDCILNFLYTSDEMDEINPKICNVLYDIIDSCDTNVFYGYSKSSVVNSFKNILKDCVDNNSSMVWC